MKITMLTDDQLAAIVAANEARMPGVWTVTDVGYGFRFTSSLRAERDAFFRGSFLSEHTGEMTPADAAFIALASWAIPALLAERARLRELVAAMYMFADALCLTLDDEVDAQAIYDEVDNV